MRGSRSPNLSQRDTSWTQSELSPLELQAPDPLDFWMDDIYTPASDRLLHRKRPSRKCPPARAYRLVALCVTAAAILVLIIVIPICTA
ncbi:major intrinsically disordered Notch2-binding receptor 1-like [Clupea harengus]|uniref:Major intrinsically disordered Notch2-binding receptor 1-like n=1 Tax=Clupea harengus TaxID=7950 RepID=A0A8M1KH30_CLUHA|nr:major intrinsically disordered Notch2-binding receptor 1-like [Clupea harengus]